MLIPALGELLTSPNDDQRILTLGSNYLLVNANMKCRKDRLAGKCLQSGWNRLLVWCFLHLRAKLDSKFSAALLLSRH